MQVAFDEGSQHEKARVALVGAYHVILYVLDTENNYFKRSLGTLCTCGRLNDSG